MSHQSIHRSITRILAALFFVVFSSAIVPTTRAQCGVALDNGFSAASELNQEGRTERPADLRITNATPGGCFVDGNTIDIVYNALMTIPAVAGSPAPLPVPDYVIVDNSPTPTLAVNVTTRTVTMAGGAQGTDIEIDIATGTSDPTAYIVLRNLRFDVTTLGDGAALNAIVASVGPPNFEFSIQVGTVRKTIAVAAPYAPAVDIVGAGYEDGVNPFGGPGPGNLSGVLVTQAKWEFSSSPSWMLVNPFREAIPVPVVSGDIPTGPTDLVIDIENIPAGVTVTLPPTITAPYVGANPEVQWVTASQTLSAASGKLIVIYNTNNPGIPQPTMVHLVVYTGPTAADATPTTPVTFGVTIADPSGTGTATIRVVMGPSEASSFVGDDVNAAAVPRYLANISGSNPTRAIITDTSNSGNPVPYFVINPTRTYLLYPYVTDLVGWQTGMEIANTGNDSTVFGNSGQAGALDFYFFPSGGTPFAFTPGSGVGRGLDTNGLLRPGGDFADTLDDLLSKSGNGSFVGRFDGYIIVAGHFNFGHGAALIFNAAGSVTTVPTLVLGGDSARLGNTTKLPERLDQ
jgi:hypothetical protein